MKKLATFYPNPIQDSIAVSVFDDILVELINTVSTARSKKNYSDIDKVPYLPST